MPQNKQTNKNNNNNNNKKKVTPAGTEWEPHKALTLKLCQAACHLTAFILGQLTLTGY